MYQSIYDPTRLIQQYSILINDQCVNIRNYLNYEKLQCIHCVSVMSILIIVTKTLVVSTLSSTSLFRIMLEGQKVFKVFLK